ncbi:MAG: MFS transporter [Metallosphaera sp.]
MNLENKIALIGGFRSFGGSIIWPFIGFALYKVYEFPLSFISIFYLIQAIVTILASISGGIITDYLGRKKTIVISTISSSMVLLLAYEINAPLVVSSVVLIQTFFNTLYNVSSTTIVGDVYKGKTELVKAFSRQRVGINAGWAIGPLVGGFIFTDYGFRTLLLAASVLVLLPIPLIKFLPDFKGEGPLAFNLSRDFVIFLIPTFLTFTIIGQLGFGLLTYYNSVLHFTEFQVGLLFGVNGLIIVALQDLTGRLINKRIGLISVGMIIYGIGYFIVSLVTNYYIAILQMVIITAAEMIVSPLSQTIANSLAHQKSRGKQMGLYSMVTGMGRIAGSSLVSELMIYYLYAPQILWGMISSLGLISSIMYYFFLKKERGLIASL